MSVRIRDALTGRFGTAEDDAADPARFVRETVRAGQITWEITAGAMTIRQGGADVARVPASDFADLVAQLRAAMAPEPSA